MATPLSASLQDYLETIHTLLERNGSVRPGEIATELGVRAPSVTKALKQLDRAGMIEHPSRGAVTLTEAGEVEAGRITRRHLVLRQLLVGLLGVEPEGAENVACEMEHALTPEVVERLAQLLTFVDARGSEDFAERFAAFRAEHDADACLAKLAEDLAPPQTSCLQHGKDAP